jgi:hypothetical protein
MQTLNQLMMGELQALSLSILLLLSFILPLTAKARVSKDARIPRPWMRTVWAGQWLTASGGLFIICLPAYPVLGFAFAIVSCVIFTRKLRRQVAVAQAP